MFKVISSHPILDSESSPKWPKAIFFPWYASINAPTLPAMVLSQFLHLPVIPNSRPPSRKAQSLERRAYRPSKKCSTMWCKHPLLPSSIILASKKKALSSCCQCRRMRPAHIKTLHYEPSIFPLLFQDSPVCLDGRVGTMITTLPGWLWLFALSVYSSDFWNTLISLSEHKSCQSRFDCVWASKVRVWSW